MTWPGKRSFNLTEPTRTKLKKTNRRARHVPEVTDSQARKTALVVAGVLFAIALWNLYRGRMTVVVILVTIAALLTLMGLFVPVAARSFHRVWMSIAAVLGYVNSRILLSLLYYGLFAPVGLVRRLFGKDPMKRRGPSQSSYWVTREYTRQTNDQFERLF